MPAGAYVRNAAAQLRNAAYELEQEAARTEAALDNSRRSHRSEIMTKQNDIRLQEAAKANMSEEDNRQELDDRIRQLTAEVKAHEEALQQEESTSGGAIAAKRAFAQDLQAQANGVEAMAGQADSV